MKVICLHNAVVSSVSVFVLFYKKERNLGANVRHEDTAHSHMVACHNIEMYM